MKPEVRPTEVLLEVRGLSVARGTRTVLSGIDLAVSRGEVLFVVGPNGSGKSTLIDACLGLVPLAAGDVSYSGRSLSGLLHAERPSFLALVGREEADALGFTVREVLALASSEALAGPHPMGAPFGSSWLTGDLLGRKLAHLSQGERQRVHLLRGFLQGAEVLFWDEATAHLDLAHREEALLAARAYAEAGHAVVVVVHELELALRHASRLLVLHHGTVQALGSAPKCLSRDLLRDVFGIAADVTGSEGDFQLRWQR